MTTLPCLPHEYYERLKALEDSYLSHADPLRQCGYGGGPINWRKKCAIVLEAVAGDGAFLDVGCANGYLLECLVSWANERGIRLIPYGLDVGERLIRLAQQRLPHWASQFLSVTFGIGSHPDASSMSAPRCVCPNHTSRFCLTDLSGTSWSQEDD